MKIKSSKILLLVTIALCIANSVTAQSNPVVEATSAKILPITPVNKVKDEKSFVKYADAALAIMEKKANELSIQGAAIVGFIPGELTSSWMTKMKVVNVLYTDKINYLAIAYTKASDMAVTLQNSGIDKTRKPLQGELGYQGGLIKKIKNGYIIAVFSGGKTAQDLQVAQEGLNAL